MAEHGSTTRYRAGCRCEPCRAAQVVMNRKYRPAKEHHGNWRGGRNVSDGYVVVLAPDHPRANHRYVREHVLIVERAMGKLLRGTAEVHHVDGNGTNNEPSNLVACDSHAYHCLLHRRTRAFLACGDPSASRCSICGGHDRQEDIHHCPPQKNRRGNTYHRDCRRRSRRLRRPQNGEPPKLVSGNDINIDLVGNSGGLVLG